MIDTSSSLPKFGKLTKKVMLSISWDDKGIHTSGHKFRLKHLD
jgi:hypothetical protein